jgi:hypothetical protein
MKILPCVLLGLTILGMSQAKDQEVAKPPLKPEIIKADVFEKRFARVGMAETMQTTEFVGVVDGVAILKVGDMNLLTKGWREKWIGTPVADLNPALRSEIEKRVAEIRAKQKADE